ncbi:malonate decarboxylase subunit beta [Klebsiella oxytoca]|nr:malonate decarboxylase subunit beta [Klebsiella oxytoca]
MRNDRSFIELRARERARTLLDDGSYRELLDPFDGIMSPWLGAQGIVPQSDDGMVVAKGTINGQPAVVIAIEGTFQGGSMGEVSGAKMAAALELAAEDNRNGIPTQAVLCLETGGVRLPGSQPGPCCHRRYSCRNSRPAPLYPGGRHRCRHRRLLRRNVHRRGAV